MQRRVARGLPGRRGVVCGAGARVLLACALVAAGLGPASAAPAAPSGSSSPPGATYGDGGGSPPGPGWQNGWPPLPPPGWSGPWPPPDDWDGTWPPPPPGYAAPGPPVVVGPPVYVPPPPLSTGEKILYAPFYAVGLGLRYGLYYLLVVPFEVLGRALSFGPEGGVEPPPPPPQPPSGWSGRPSPPAWPDDGSDAG